MNWSPIRDVFFAIFIKNYMTIKTLWRQYNYDWRGGHCAIKVVLKRLICPQFFMVYNFIDVTKIKINKSTRNGQSCNVGPF